MLPANASQERGAVVSLALLSKEEESSAVGMASFGREGEGCVEGERTAAGRRWGVQTRRLA